jgi:uncharacterized membrane protein
MNFILPTLFVLTLVASVLLKLRLFAYRYDEKWRRERGAWLGSLPLALWSGEVYKRANYAAEGHRLIPIAIALEILTIALGIAAFIRLAGAA